MNNYELAFKIGFFLQQKGLNSWDVFVGKFSAKEQREFFGLYFGKGTLIIDGKNEKLTMQKKVCFGTDIQDVFCIDCKNPNESFYNDLKYKKIIENYKGD